MMKKILISAACTFLLTALLFFGAFWLSVGAVNYGKFYTLQEAYDAGILNYADLKNIADINSGESVKSESEKLSRFTEFKIKCAASDTLKEYFNKSIKEHFGAYGGAVAIKIKDRSAMIPTVITIFTVADILFEFPTEVIVVWKN